MEQLSALDKVHRNRSGRVEIDVGILNVGASDGTVPSEATVTFSGGKFTALHPIGDKDESKGYTVIKAHTFAEAPHALPASSGSGVDGDFVQKRKSLSSGRL